MNRYYCAALSLTIVGCDVPPPVHIAIVTDRSGSIEDGSGRSCPGIAGLAEKAINIPGIDDRSTITVWATGDNASARAPIEFLPTTAIPFSASPLEGAARKRRERNALVTTIDNRCRETVRLADMTPLYLAISTAIQSLRVQGCTAQSSCRLFIQSDLQETVEAEIASALLGQTPVAALMIPPLDTTGLELFICGTGQTLGTLEGPVSPALLNRTEQVWSSLLGKSLSGRISPQCPRAATTQSESKR